MEILKSHYCNFVQMTTDGCRDTHNQSRTFKDGQPSFDYLINIINTIIGPCLDKWEYNFTLRFNLLNNTVDEIKETLNMIHEKYRKYIRVFFRYVYDTVAFNGKNINTAYDYSELIAYADSIGFSIMYNPHFVKSCEACSNTNFVYIAPDFALWKCLNAKGATDEFGKIGQIEDISLMSI